MGIPDALGEVSEDAEQEYKEARYKWQHVIPGELSPEQVERAERLEREEVFPGYSTLVEKGKHREYLEQYGDPYGIFEGDTTEKNRPNVEKFIKLPKDYKTDNGGDDD